MSARQPKVTQPSTFATRRAAREAAGRPARVPYRSPNSVSDQYREPVTIPARVPVKERTADAQIIVVPRGGSRRASG